MIIHADCVEAMQAMEPESVDAIVCDPPYGLGFMGKEWDETSRLASVPPSGTPDTPLGRFNTGKGQGAVAFDGLAFQGWCQLWATEALRVLKPGGHLLAFGGTRTYHRLACAVEDAGFEIRDSLIWIYGSGFPKSRHVGRAIDAERGVESRRREYANPGDPDVDNSAGRGQAGSVKNWGGGEVNEHSRSPQWQDGDTRTVPEGVTPEAQQWQGWGTALKPAHEPIVVARKPLVGTVAANVLAYGTGAINVDACRIEGEPRTTHADGNHQGTSPHPMDWDEETEHAATGASGRWPPNLTLSHLPECKQTGTRKVKATKQGTTRVNPLGMMNDDGWESQNNDRPATINADSDGTETIPAYTCAEGCPVAELDRQSGERGGGRATGRDNRPSASKNGYGPEDEDGWSGNWHRSGEHYGDTGGASRFFYVAKASRAERNAGLEGFEERDMGEVFNGGIEGASIPLKGSPAPTYRNHHPTVKPIALMRWLVRLVTPKGGTVLDPFCGSGSTGVAAVLEGFDFVGIEREAEYVALAEARVAFWAQFPGADVDKVLLSDARAREIEASGQLGLL